MQESINFLVNITLQCTECTICISQVKTTVLMYIDIVNPELVKALQA